MAVQVRCGNEFFVGDIRYAIDHIRDATVTCHEVHSGTTRTFTVSELRQHRIYGRKVTPYEQASAQMLADDREVGNRWRHHLEELRRSNQFNQAYD